MRFLSFFCIAFVLLALIPCTAAVKVEQARAEWMGGFQKMENADKAAETNVVGALELYREALAVFEVPPRISGP